MGGVDEEYKADSTDEGCLAGAMVRQELMTTTLEGGGSL